MTDLTSRQLQVDDWSYRPANWRLTAQYSGLTRSGWSVVWHSASGTFEAKRRDEAICGKAEWIGEVASILPP